MKDETFNVNEMMTHGGTPSVAWVSGGVARRCLEIFPAFDVEYWREKIIPFLKHVIA